MKNEEAEKAIASLPARRVEQVLNDLISLRRRWREGEQVMVPQATLHLRSGRDVTGYVIDVALDVPKALIVHTPSHDSRWSVTYLDPAAIEAISVYDVLKVAPFLSDGKVEGTIPAPADGSPPPTRLEVKRATADRQAALAKALGHEIAIDVSWEGIAEQGEPLRTLSALIADTVQSLEEVSRKDPPGKEAVGRLKKLWFGDGAKAALRQNDTLVITARYAMGPAGRLSKTELVPAIEKVL